MNRISYDIPVTTFRKETIILKCFRLKNEVATPVILFPGFDQNGWFWDVMPGDRSLAEYLSLNGMDIWVVNPRGTGGSGGKKSRANMDDFAADDIPSIIGFVSHETGKKPVFVGHSQGGITAIMSLMGGVKDENGEVGISEAAAKERQESLHALVTMGSFLNFTWEKEPPIARFVRNGFRIKIFGSTITLVKSITLLKILRLFQYIPVPVGVRLREKLLKGGFLSIVLAPLVWILNAVAYSGLWSFLYYIPNVDRISRRYLFYRTLDATFWGIVNQFYWAIMNGRMNSTDFNVNYSAHFETIRLPVSCVGMEFDPIEDAEQMRKKMFDRFGSKTKHFTLWKDQGHENFVMNPGYFQLAKDAIELVL